MEKNIILEIKNVKKGYKEQSVLNEISMKLEKGKIYGIIGPNGVGKTTLIRIIAGMSQMDSGEIRYYQDDEVRNNCEFRNRIGCIIEAPYLDESLTAMENLHISGYLNGVKDEAVLGRCLEQVGLKNEKKKVRDFSLGMKQRLGIACLLVKEPQILFLDEPMNGMDPEGIMTLRNMLSDMSHKEGRTIVVTSHILSELKKLCDALYFINKGNVVRFIEGTEPDMDLEELYMDLMVGGNRE